MYQLNKHTVTNIIFLCFLLSSCKSISYNDKHCGDDCKLLFSCPDAMTLLNQDPFGSKNTLIKVHCGFEENVPKVCCSELSRQLIESHPNLNLLPENCGFINDERIIHGHRAGLYEFPWMVLISHQSHGGSAFQCGGTLINERYVLTAAHCIVDKKIAGVRIGENDIRTDTDCEGELPKIICENRIQDIEVEKAIPHEHYKPKPFNTDDIGLLRLKRPVDLTAKNAGAICLPVTSQLRNTDIENRTATIAGWGATEDSSASNVLLRAHVKTYTKDECRDIKYRNTIINDHKEERTMNKICALGNDTDSCKGDSGGPLMIIGRHHGTNRYIEYGIISYGPSQCASEIPGLYTEISPYMNWILDNIRN